MNNRDLKELSALINKVSIYFVRGQIGEGSNFLLEYEKLLNSLTDKSSSLNSLQKVTFLTLKSWDCFYKGELNKALEFAKQIQAFPLPEISGSKLYIANNFYQFGYIYLNSGEPNEALDYAMKSLHLQKELDNRSGVGNCLCLVGDIYYNKGDFNKALKFLKQSLSVKEINKQIKPNILRLLGNVYQEKGELDKALKYYKKSIAIAEELNMDFLFAFDLMYIGSLYRMMGNYERAIEYLERSLVLSEKVGFALIIVLSLLWLIFANLDKGSREQVQRYIIRLKQFADRKDSKIFTQAYLLAKALILKTSGRIRDHAEAEVLLKQIVEDEIMVPQTHIFSLISLCGLLLEELSISNNPEVLEEINPLIMRLVNVAENQLSYSWLAEAKVLQAKIALIQMNIKEAKQVLTEAQRLADLHGLNLLAAKISSEHDFLLECENDWESFKMKDAPMVERIKLASIDGNIDRLQGKLTVDPPEMVNEEPILLLIMHNSGVTYFNHPFMANWDYSDLFSSFMSAFNTFSSEMFSKSIDRIRIGENTILLETVEPFLTCYVIKGQSYPALQKLTRFSKVIRENSEIWQALNKSIKTHKMLELNKPSVLNSVINEIFTY